MIRSDATFDNTFPFAPRFTDVPGFEMHYVDEGPRDGEVVLCLHGEPTWGYLFRHLISALSPTHRVVAPDHMGFGKSGTPFDQCRRPNTEANSAGIPPMRPSRSETITTQVRQTR
jgi:cis-3-alkyl-4-acyloxetan-2-one decarboxylase